MIGSRSPAFGGIDPSAEQDLLDPPTAVHGEALPPNPACSAVWVECRSEDRFVGWVRDLARNVDDPVWVLDGDGVLWLSSALDPAFSDSDLRR